MDKSYKSNNEHCPKYQEQLSGIYDNKSSLEDDQSLKSHVQDCSDCQAYLQGLIALKNRLSDSPRKNLDPDSRIQYNIIAYSKIKNGLKGAKPNPVWRSIRELFEYRVPVYQALSGVVVIFLLFLYISTGVVSPGNKASSLNYTGDYEHITSSELYLVDTLNLGYPDRGQNAKEDSVLMSFLVPTM